MPDRAPESGFIERFERAMEGTETRLRNIESSQAALTQEMKSLKEDRCAKHDRSIEELYNSRNEMARTLEQLRGSATGLTKICESLDKTVESLDKRALLLGKGEESVVEQLSKIQQWNVPARLQTLETTVGDIETAREEQHTDGKNYKMMIYGAIVGCGFSILAGLVTYLLTR